MKKIQEKFNIICLANQVWDWPLHTNKRLVMERIGKLSNNVLFVDPPINTGRLFLRHILQRRWPIKRLITGRYNDGNITIFSPLNPHPGYKRLSYKHAKRINKIASKIFDRNLKTILWIYHVEIPSLEIYLKEIKHDFLVYDCVDNYEAFPRYSLEEKKKEIISQERMLASRANIVFATAPGLVEKLRKINPNTYYTPNVGDYDRYINIRNSTAKIPQDLKGIKKPIIMFTGAVDDYKFDKDLVKRLASDYPSYSFVIIGPVALKDKEATKKALGFGSVENVYFLGQKEYEDVPKYISKADVLIIPYRLNDYTVGGCFPAKFHDYLASGLPVVVTDLPAYSPFSDVCYISKDYNEFSHNIRKALEEDSEILIKKRQKVASQNTWDQKVDKMLSLVSKSIKSI